jgi:spermidine/putrescine transport system substrate-binding protein
MDDDAIINVGVGALMSGQDINDPKDLAAVTAALKSIKPNVKLLWSTEDQWNKSFAAKEFDLSLFWSGGSVRSKRNSKLPVDFRRSEGRRHRLGRWPRHPGIGSERGGRACFCQLDDRPGLLRRVGNQGRRSGLLELGSSLEALPADDLSRQVHKPEYLKTMGIMSALPDDRREAFNNRVAGSEGLLCGMIS